MQSVANEGVIALCIHAKSRISECIEEAQSYGIKRS